MDQRLVPVIKQAAVFQNTRKNWQVHNKLKTEDLQTDMRSLFGDSVDVTLAVELTEVDGKVMLL